jgi:hypothetical protein
MNRDPMSFILAAVLLASAAITAGLCYWFLQNSRQHQILQSEVIRVNRNRALLQAFGNDAIEYSRKNPAILPVLQSLGMRRANTNPAPGK